MERKLASIQKVLKLDPIEGADKIEKATVLGWELVVKKGEFTVGDLCIFCEVDSIMPEKPEFEFLRIGRFRIKTRRMRGQISQGIAFPVSILGEGAITFAEGDDVTEIIGVKKYEPYSAEARAQLAGICKSTFPSWLIKTDETRIQAEPRLLEKYNAQLFHVTEKLDGSSMTVYLNNGEFGVCSRNMDLLEDANNAFWKVALELDLKGRLIALGGNHALQGELVGLGVQGNKYRLDGLRFYVFNLFNIDTRKFYDSADFVHIVKEIGLTTVPVLETHHPLSEDVPGLVALSNAASVLNSETPREGIVFRPIYETFEHKFGRLSFKVINPEFLLRYDE